MSKILKNNTASPITVTDTGVTIPASPGSYTIPAQDYLLWAASSNTVTFVGASSLIVNDGSNDLTISNGTDLIKGIFPTFSKAEDTPSADGDIGVPAMAIRKATPANTSGADGDYEMLQMSAGRLWTSTTGTVSITGSITVDQGTQGSQFSPWEVQVGDGSGNLFGITTSGEGKVFVGASATNIAKAEDVASASADVGVPAMAIRKATPANLSNTDGDYEMLQMSGGRLWVDASGITLLVTNVLPTNAATATAQGTGNATLSDIKGQLPATLGQKTMANSLAVVIASDQSAVPITIAGGTLSVLGGSLSIIGAGGSLGVLGFGGSMGVLVNGGSLSVMGGSLGILGFGGSMGMLGIGGTITVFNAGGTLGVAGGSLGVLGIGGTMTIFNAGGTLGVAGGSLSVQGFGGSMGILGFGGSIGVLGFGGSMGIFGAGGTMATILFPSASSAFAPTRSVSTAFEASRVVKASAGNLYSVIGYSSRTSSQFIQVFNNSSLPADAGGTLIYTFVAPASSNFSLDLGPMGDQFSTGIVVCNSSTASTKTIGSADCWFTVRYQ